MELDSNPNLKITNLPNNKFEPISNFQMKLLFPNITLKSFIGKFLVAYFDDNHFRLVFDVLAREKLYDTVSNFLKGCFFI